MLTTLSMMQRLLLAILSPIILGFVVLGGLIALQLNETIPPLIENGASKQAEARASEISHWLAGYHKWINALSTAQELQSLEDEDLTSLTPWLAKHKGNDAAIDSLFFTRLDGLSILDTGQTTSIASRDYFQDLVIKKTASHVLSNPVISNGTGNQVAVVAQVVNNAQGETIGLIGLTLSMEELSNIANSLEMGEGSYGWVVDGTGLIVAHPSPKARMKTNVTTGDKDGYTGINVVGERILKSQPGIGHILNIQGEPVTMIWHPIPKTPNWTVGVSVPELVFTGDTTLLLTNVTIVIFLVLTVLTLIIIFIARQQIRPIKRMAQRMHDIAEGEADLTQQLTLDRQDELGELAQSFNLFIERIRELVSTIGQTIGELTNNAHDVENNSQSMGRAMQNQQSEIDMIAVAMNELVATVDEVARHAQEASETAQTGGQETNAGTRQVTQVIQAIKHQSNIIQKTADEVERLQRSGQQISDVMGVIRSIAEQTNLLALNAAIEAARAGEAGRGFAVVADEVRTLAARTHESTQQIEQTVTELLERITAAVTAMHSSNESTNATVINAEEAGQALVGITQAIENIENMNFQIASATEEQSSTVDELNRNLERIVDLSNTTNQTSQEMTISGTQLSQVAQELHNLIRRFKVN